MAKATTDAPEKNLTEWEEIELEWKKLQIIELREKIQARQELRDRAIQNAKRNLEDYEKAQAVLEHRQRVCKHRKGGRNNQFARGDSPQYSIIRNTYPTGEEVIMCTRCYKEVHKPHPRLRKKDPIAYEKAFKLWREWDDLPTDNSPSGGKIFEIVAA